MARFDGRREATRVDESDREGEQARDSGVLTFAIRFVHASAGSAGRPVEPESSPCVSVTPRLRV